MTDTTAATWLTQEAYDRLSAELDRLKGEGRNEITARIVAGDEMVFLLGSREIAGTADIDVFSPTSPLGAAINGTKVGDKTSYAAPNGNEIPVKILGAKPFDA